MKLAARLPQQKGRLTASISEGVIQDLEIYHRILTENHNSSASISQVVEEMLVDFMQSDKDFQRQLKKFDRAKVSESAKARELSDEPESTPKAEQSSSPAL